MKQLANSKFGLVLVVSLIALSTPGFGQSSVANRDSTLAEADFTVAKYPHPYVYGGLQLNGAGYTPTAWVGGAGLNIELKHLAFDGSASYDNARKVNDNTLNNYSGHDRGLRGDVFYRFSKLYVGGGASWTQLSTTNYTKQSWHPDFGVGRDWLKDDYSIRAQLLYKLPGSDHLNAAQGPELSLWMPSPLTDHHVFTRETIGIYTFHDTVTDPADPQLAATQEGNRSVTGAVSMTLLYRF